MVVVAGSGRDVAGQSDAGQGSQRQLRRPADAGFQHAANPQTNTCFPAQVVNLARFGPAADAGWFDVDDVAGVDGQGQAGRRPVDGCFRPGKAAYLICGRSRLWS